MYMNECKDVDAFTHICIHMCINAYVIYINMPDKALIMSNSMELPTAYLAHTNHITNIYITKELIARHNLS